MHRKKAPISEEFPDLRARLAEWRKNHPRRSPLPEEMWMAAVELARRHGLYRTARALPIDYANLRKRLKRAAPSSVAARPEFVEVLVAPAQSGACVEVLRVALTGAVDWNQLFRAWRQGGR
jgi:hypothetical protein